ncbi:MAG: acetylglutamate kinase [Pseudomonadota bacterium]
MEIRAQMHRDWLATARTLSEALPYLQRYDGTTIVVKFGGNAMGDRASLDSFARDVVLMKQCNLNPVVVHGGGPQINAMLARLGVETEFRDGLRVTTEEAVQVVEMVLSGAINKGLVAAINAQGGRAVGLSGKDARLMTCEKATHTTRDPDSAIERVLDLGYVGRPVEIDPGVLERLIGSDFIPVVAPVGGGREGHETFNVNADTAAGAIAGAMRAERLLLLTDVEGVKDGEGRVLTRLTRTDVERLIGQGTIAGGMIPKVQTALAAIEQGVDAAAILDGRQANAVLLELFTEHGAGTLIGG